MMSPESPPRDYCVMVEASAAGLAVAQPGLERFLMTAGVAGPVLNRAAVLVEEVVMNVATHGLADGAGGVVALQAAARPDGGCTLVFEDAGCPFDPTAGALPAPPQDLDAARIGGLGLVLLRRLASEIAYERLPQGRNRLRVTLTGPRTASL